jgi:hypothetical protein
VAVEVEELVIILQLRVAQVEVEPEIVVLEVLLVLPELLILEAVEVLVQRQDMLVAPAVLVS